MKNGLLIVQRGTTWQDYVRAYKIVVDGVEVGEIRRGRELSVEVSEGEHTVQARIAWTGSKESTVCVAAGGEVRVNVAPSPRTKGAKLVDRALSTDEYLVLTVEEPS